ncbi:MAG: DUF4145 domain-containing protein [Methylophaga sp.]|nr:DUF4145 domain-containing protein [Methylophaga sp.]
MNYEQYKKYNRLKFKESFSKTDVPSWNCPHCNKAPLSLITDELKHSETLESQARRSSPVWEPEQIEYLFSATFFCPNCNCPTYCTGVGQHIFWRDPPFYELNKDIIFTPKYFEPTLLLFTVPQKCPQSISEILIASFAIAWIDLSSSGNKLRVAVEKIVAELKPDLNKKMSLHHKIKNLEDSHPEISQLLLSIKWLGNNASHDNSLLECDLVIGYLIMENILGYLYQSKSIDSNNLVEIINAYEGSPVQKINKEE